MQFSNPLIHSLSPYLRQHAHNPVYWYPWGAEALARAKAEDKPILLSIGYSTCYWCHVMEREVFENPSIATVMNRLFINIKVDREEHPHLDDIYMTARQLLTQEGGWPNNIFLTPDLKPFYAGGTYGATDMYGKPAFPRLVEWLSDAWVNKREDTLRAANELTALMQNFLVETPAESSPALITQAIVSARAALAKYHDEISGGFFQAPKFPQENYLQFLLTHHAQTGDKSSLDMAAFTLGKMAAGGIYDHVGCGFHRYAVDKDWMVPHFEKMLYTQGLLANCYRQAAQATGSFYFEDMARGTCEFIAGPFTDGDGAFYAALDAETDGVEGAYYAWTRKEIESLLTSDEAKFFVHHYGLAEIPHFPGHKHPEGEVIIARAPLAEAALQQNLPYENIAMLAGGVLNKLLEHRNLRPSVGLDEKIITGWNGLMIDALAAAGAAFNEQDYVKRARKAADYFLEHAIDNDGNLMRCVVGGRAMHRASLDDYAYLIKGLLSLHTASKDKPMLDAATQLTARVEELFSDDNPGFFFTQADEPALVRIKSGDDSTLPNPNAIMAHNYITLFEITQDATYQHKARALIEFFISGEKNWLEYTTMLSAAMRIGLYTFLTQNASEPPQKTNVVRTRVELPPLAAGEVGEMRIALLIQPGYHIAPFFTQSSPDMIPTQLSLQGTGLQLMGLEYPEPALIEGKLGYQGEITVIARVKRLEGVARLLLRYQPCTSAACFNVVDDVVAIG